MKRTTATLGIVVALACGDSDGSLDAAGFDGAAQDVMDAGAIDARMHRSQMLRSGILAHPLKAASRFASSLTARVLHRIVAPFRFHPAYSLTLRC